MEFTNLVQGLTQFIQQASTEGSSTASAVVVPDSTAPTRPTMPETEPPSGSGTGTAQTGS
jgi:hypothetical protein